jgi:hypothetical protein
MTNATNGIRMRTAVIDDNALGERDSLRHGDWIRIEGDRVVDLDPGARANARLWGVCYMDYTHYRYTTNLHWSRIGISRMYGVPVTAYYVPEEDAEKLPHKAWRYDE